MMIGLLVAGVAAILAGILAIAYGFLLDLSFGNTLILAGAFGVCGGLIVLGQTLVVYELRKLGRRLGPGAAADLDTRSGQAQQGFAPPREPPPPALPEPEGQPLPAPSAPPWRGEASARERPRPDAATAPETAPLPEEIEPAPPPSRRRNLMFSSTMRRDRERPAQPAEEPAAEPPFSPPEAEASLPGFDEVRPRERMRPLEPPSRRARAPLPFRETKAAPPEWSESPPPDEEPPAQAAAIVIKSGVVDGMAYSLYSDGSIEAQMPEGMMRFASIDELRAHLDQRS